MAPSTLDAIYHVRATAASLLHSHELHDIHSTLAQLHSPTGPFCLLSHPPAFPLWHRAGLPTLRRLCTEAQLAQGEYLVALLEERVADEEESTHTRKLRRRARKKTKKYFDQVAASEGQA